MLKFINPERVWLKDHPDFNEKWVQKLIAENPEILGLGDVELRDRERPQPRAGRLDLLVQDSELGRRYEIEVQLGKTDESHLVRTIEYWDIERKRYPQYEHCAVIVAEDITTRFLNVIGLFNTAIPLIAIQMTAYRIGDHITLTFTKVLDQVELGLVDEDEEVQSPVDRAYWEARGSKTTVAMADQCLEMIRTFDPSLELKYNKYYIGLAKNSVPDNWAIFRPKKNILHFEVRLPKSDQIDKELEEAGLDVLEYSRRYGQYRISLTKDEIAHRRDLLLRLLRAASGRGAMAASAT